MPALVRRQRHEEAPLRRHHADRLGDEPLELRSSAWHRLLATFRAVHSGIEHDLLTKHGMTLRLAANGDKATLHTGNVPNEFHGSMADR